MIIERIPAGVYAVNCYVVTCSNTKKTAIIDPGGDALEIIQYIDENKLDVECIILTHGHGDHIGGVKEIKEIKDIPVFIHKEDGYMLENADKNLSSFMGGPSLSFIADQFLKDGDTITFGTLKADIIHTPGHTQGSICIRLGDSLFSGDTLFAGSIGRTDLEGGSFEQIIDSIKRKLMVFDNNVTVYPGHGSNTTIGVERNYNPFINR